MTIKTPTFSAVGVISAFIVHMIFIYKDTHSELLLLTLFLVVFSVFVGLVTQYLIENSGVKLIRYIFENKIDDAAEKVIVDETTPSSSMITINFAINWLVSFHYIRLTEGKILWTIDSWDILRVTGAVFLVDLLYYIFHRSMHIPVIYRHYHKWHHENRNPDSWADSVLADAVDWVLGSIVFFSPMLVMNITPAVLIIMTWMAIHVQLNHCGYKLPKLYILVSPIEHYAHHQYKHYNYCELTTILDTIFGTYMSEKDVFNKKQDLLKSKLKY
jgi:sterol desaturase/sphingolipid hydroxylase (fatty acid hydroxylase superfamily)